MFGLLKKVLALNIFEKYLVQLIAKTLFVIVTEKNCENFSKFWDISKSVPKLINFTPVDGIFYPQPIQYTISQCYK